MDFIHYKPGFDYYSSDQSEDERDEDLAMDYGYVLQLIDMDVYPPVPDVRMEEPTEEPVTVKTSMEEITTDLSAISIANDGKNRISTGLNRFLFS
ncbi:hypothetical protein [Parasitella parasitica]|uniref:Uncharacterized protein n=1 Tax=Parasitella parasitica TaxID=35722 RepID=A0A0B7N2D8_9FUNG|nr:hypothetical protein [Parasitella parasitica]